VPCRLNPAERRIFATTEWLMSCPIAVSSRARLRVDFVVHRNGDSGSPRVPGSMRESSRSSSSGSATSAFLRPPPGARTRSTRPTGSLSSLSNSARPRRMVDRDAPVARCTAAMPPRPHDVASVANAKRRSRSLRLIQNLGKTISAHGVSQ
jgi:hypothetical protein